MVIPASMLKLVFKSVTVLLLVVGASVATFFAAEDHLHKLIPERVVRVAGFANLSGIAYWPEHGTLIGVADSGEVAEIDLDGRVLRRAFDQPRKLGDIVLSDEPGYALVTDVQQGLLLRLDLARLRFVAETPVRFDSPGSGMHTQRFEGVAIEPNSGRLILANAVHPAALLFVSPNETIVRDVVLVNAPRLGSIIRNENGQLLVVSPDNGLLLTSADGIPVGDWYPVKGRQIAGATVVPGVGLVLATNQAPAQLLFFTSLSNWEEVQHALGS